MRNPLTRTHILFAVAGTLFVLLATAVAFKVQCGAENCAELGMIISVLLWPTIVLCSICFIIGGALYLKTPKRTKVAAAKAALAPTPNWMQKINTDIVAPFAVLPALLIFFLLPAYNVNSHEASMGSALFLFALIITIFPLFIITVIGTFRGARKFIKSSYAQYAMAMCIIVPWIISMFFVLTIFAWLDGGTNIVALILPVAVCIFSLACAIFFQIYAWRQQR